MPPRPAGPFAGLIALLVELAVDEYMGELAQDAAAGKDAAPEGASEKQ